MQTRILFDFNNLFMRHLFLGQVNVKRNPQLNFLSYLIFDYIQTEVDKIEDSTTKEVILAQDNPGGYWRRDIYPEYKKNRKKDETIDWPRIYDYINSFTETLSKYSPWKVLQVDKCEADDIIAVLARENTEGISIVHSGDIDYVQLASDNIRVYNPHYDGYVTFPTELKVNNGITYVESPEDFLNLYILTGQPKDNIGNIKTDTGHEGRKPPFGLKRAIKAVDDEGIEKYAEDENFKRNKQLIDLKEIPEEIQQSILEAYRNYLEPEVNITKILEEYPWPSVMQKAASIQERWDNV